MKQDVAMQAQFKRERSDEGGTDQTETVKKRAKGRGDAEMEVGEIFVNQENEEEAYEKWAVDDISGKDLDFELVKEARAEEVKFMEGLGVWEESSREECWDATNKGPVSTKWVDIDKGRDGQVLVRSRLVARDFKVKGGANDFDVFAAMPPLEAKRMLMRMAMVEGAVGGNEESGAVKVMFIDVKKAHLNGRVKESEFAYVQLPDEAGGGVARLRRWLYGMRPAASAWEDDYVEHLTSAGFRRGKSAPTVLLHEGRGIRLVVWGDDFTFLGRDADLKWAANVMTKRYELKIRAVLGPDRGDDKWVRILNRKVRWEEDRIVYEGDEKHVDTVTAGMGLDEDSRGLDVPVAHDEVITEGEELEAGEAAKYRQLAATVNYLALDRPDVQYAASVLGRAMSRPTVQSMAALKRVARYLHKHRAVEFEYVRVRGNEAGMLTGYSDSDWAGCKTSRRSMSGGLVTLAGGTLKAWSNRQASVALSSGEAEYYASVKCAAELLGVRSLARDLGWEFGLRMLIDSTAAKAIASRLGTGKVRHLEVRFLWLQELTRSHQLSIAKIAGTVNPADVLTKSRTFHEALSLLRAVGLHDPGCEGNRAVGGCQPHRH